MLLSIPLRNKPARQFRCNLNNQDCTLILRQKGNYMYLSLFVSDVPVVQNAICLNRVPIIIKAQNIFSGNLVFIDTLGSSAPQYNLLENRFQFVYYSEGENIPNIVQISL